MKMFPQGSDNSFLDRPSAGPTNWYAHFVMAFQAIKILFDLSGVRPQFDTTIATIEMISMIWFALIDLISFKYRIGQLLVSCGFRGKIRISCLLLGNET